MNKFSIDACFLADSICCKMSVIKVFKKVRDFKVKLLICSMKLDDEKNPCVFHNIFVLINTFDFASYFRLAVIC